MLDRFGSSLSYSLGLPAGEYLTVTLVGAKLGQIYLARRQAFPEIIRSRGPSNDNADRNAAVYFRSYYNHLMFPQFAR